MTLHDCPFVPGARHSPIHPLNLHSKSLSIQQQPSILARNVVGCVPRALHNDASVPLACGARIVIDRLDVRESSRRQQPSILLRSIAIGDGWLLQRLPPAANTASHSVIDRLDHDTCQQATVRSQGHVLFLSGRSSRSQSAHLQGRGQRRGRERACAVGGGGGSLLCCCAGGIPIAERGEGES
jgi:hypothetical protein